MAPILSASIGIAEEIVDDERLRSLRSSLEEIRFKAPLDSSDKNPEEEVAVPLDIERLVELLEPWRSWTFEEQVDLQEWVDPLNKIDASLSYYLQRHPSLLLIGPVERTNSKGSKKTPRQPVSKPARSLEEVNNVPDTVHKNLVIILNFLSGLLLNSSNKSIFNSAEELADLLAAADDDIASAALDTLCSLATPPSLHKQQIPEIQQHTTALHASKSQLHKRLIALARGWGTRGSGLGLYTCAVADDSESGQCSLLQQAGELHFTFFRMPTTEEEKADEDMDESFLVRIDLQASDIIDDSGMITEASKYNDESDDSSKQKRRRVAPAISGGKRVRSTAELFLQCIDQAGGPERIPDDRLFPLLADIRLTRSFYCQSSRVSAIERRLQALITCLHAHPSQDVMSGYFQAQPELCVELVDLLRPTVSSAVVSSAASSSSASADQSIGLDGIAALANSPVVPYKIRDLALQSLTALVSRRDGSNGALAGVARHSNVLSELGVGKGQYLGLLPTLIRYSLASLEALVSSGPAVVKSEHDPSLMEKCTEQKLGIELGLAFVEATTAPALAKFVRLERALLFIDSVLTLTSAVVSTPTGTSALTECGIIPALLNTVSIDPVEFVATLLSNGDLSAMEGKRIRSMLRFITAQAVQILEGAIVTHNNALSAFHNLQGVEILTTRLSKEIMIVRDGRVRVESGERDDAMDIETSQEAEMEIDNDSQVSTTSNLQASQRVLLFGIVTCLTVVFHQESTSSSVSTPSGSTELRKPELTNAVIEILDNVEMYGGHLASLISTLLSDVMNSDPHVVRYVHESGLAKSFLAMLGETNSGEPIVPPVAELIMTIPNVLAALALTESGSKAVKESNPFPGLLKIFHHPKYAMPQSKCLLNEMTSIVGTGLDEIMRHVPSLKRQICTAIANAMMQIVLFGLELSSKEESLTSVTNEAVPTDNDDERSCLIQFSLNFGQVLEQILHNEEHCDPFVQAGGLDAILQMYPYLMPAGDGFLDNISSLSCPSVGTLCHSTTEDSLSLAFKCIALRYDPLKLLRKVIECTTQHVEQLEAIQKEMRVHFPTNKFTTDQHIDASYILDGVPRKPVYDIADAGFVSKKRVLSRYLRKIATVQWLTSLLSAAIKASCQRSQETGSGWSRTEREWKKELSKPEFQSLFERLSTFFQSATMEVCRIRTEDGFEERDLKMRNVANSNVRYKLRIVCTEGAIVRDGIEIDDAASVGSMEMGEVVMAVDRCINSSGVLRYRTLRGWVSEHTRGHGREPIAEVLAIWTSQEETQGTPKLETKRVESGIPDLCATSASVFARMQTSYSELCSSLTRVGLQSLRTLSLRNISFQDDNMARYISTLMRMLQNGISVGFGRPEVLAAVHAADMDSTSLPVSKKGVALFLGTLLNHLQTCLFEEKRDRRTVNLPLLIPLADLHFKRGEGTGSGAPDATMVSLFDAISFIFELGLEDFETRSSSMQADGEDLPGPLQSVNRVTASSFPPAMSMLRKMLSGSSITSSSYASVLSKFKSEDVEILLGQRDPPKESKSSDGSNVMFSPDKFARRLFSCVSDSVMKPWNDPRFGHAPPHVVHPIATLVSETIAALDDSTKKTSTTSSTSNSRESSSVWNPFRSMLQNVRGAEAAAQGNEFEPSEEAIARLMEMGFSRDHSWEALDSVRTNRVDVAMEYALAHPASSPEVIERRRNERATRRQQREQQQQQQQQQPENADVAGQDVVEEGDELRNRENSESMDLDSSQEPAKKATPKDETIEGVTSRLNSWKEKGPDIACGILATIRPHAAANNEGDAENEALTVVLSDFLLDLQGRFASDRDDIVKNIVVKLKTQLTEANDNQAQTPSNVAAHESSIASLCHCTVIFIRALPKMRTLLLKEGVIHRIVSLISGFLKEPKNELDAPGKRTWPLWLPSSLLLLDIMAQPVVAFDASDGTLQEESDSEEFNQVRNEHAKQVSDVAALAQELFAALNNTKANDELESRKSTEESKPSAGPNGDNPDSDRSTNFFKAVPPYYPLLPPQCFESCAEMCLSLLDASSPPPPGVAHASLSLLLRLVRDPKVSSYCLDAGAGEKILALTKYSRFSGHSGLAAVIFRLLLEDAATLQSAMETEIRSAISKLDGKRETSVDGEKEKIISVPRKSFLEAVTPLLCRDPASFVKAIAVSVVFEKDTSGEWRVCLLTQTQRSRNMKVVSETMKMKSSPPIPTKGGNSRRSSSSKHKRASNTNAGTRSKTPTRSHKRHHSAKENSKLQTQQNAPISQVTSLLINHVIQWSAPGATDSDTTAFDFGFDSTFLWTANTLEVLADLALAMPACATSIHKFKPSKRNRALFSSVNNALQGCVTPPRTFVSFLLHSLLSQDCGFESQKFVEAVGAEIKTLEQREKLARKTAKLRMKVVQAAARLLVALVARPGEGRRRVIVELVFALSGGKLGHSSASSFQPSKLPAHLRSSELHALKAWGELTMGFAAPRFINGNSVEGNTSLSFPVIKTMLESGVCHALLCAIHRVPRHHPAASRTVGCLILPFEILTRSGVTDVVRSMVEKESSTKETKASDKQVDSTEATHSELEDAFVNERQSENDDDDLIIDDSHDEMADMDEESSHEESSEEEDDDDEEESSSMDDSGGDNSSSSDSDNDDSSTGVEDSEGAFEEDNDGFIEDQEDNDGLIAQEDNQEENAPDDGFVEDGWTRIESNGFGGMVLGGRRSAGGTLNAAGPGRQGGFIDAAEAMIGQLLRSGEIPQEALAEIEGSLGIRIVQPSATGASASGPGNRGNNYFRGNSRNARPDPNRPHVFQRNQPDFGYSSIGGGARWNEINAMEYVYGGPCIAAGNRNYDLITPLEEPSEDEVQGNVIDTQPLLFPGGPAAATHSRTQNSIHPLLEGVTLPPVNALVSDLRPHGVIARSTLPQTGDSSGSGSRRGFFISNNGGGATVTQVVGSNRPQSRPGAFGWTGDESPLLVEQFATAFENAIEESMRAAALPEETHNVGLGDVGEDSDEGEVNEEPAATETADQSNQNETEDTDMVDNVQDADAGEETSPTRQEPQDGDGVASSLAEGLRLSPGNQDENNTEQHSNGEQDDRSDDEAMVDADDNPTEAQDADEDREETDPSQDPVEEQTGQVAVNADDNPTESAAETQPSGENPDRDALVCPPGMDEEVFNVLPVEMQMEVVREAREASELTEQLDAGSSLDPEALAALPDDVRREVIAQDQRERRMREQAPADPSNAEEMDNASFLASLAPELRNEILLTADDAFIASLPPIIAAEAQVLRERARADHRMLAEQANEAHNRGEASGNVGGGDEGNNQAQGHRARDHSEGHSSRRKQRAGKLRVELDRVEITYIPTEGRTALTSPIAKSDMKALIGFLYLLSPVRPSKLLQKVFQNVSMNGDLRSILLTVFMKLLQNDNEGVLAALDSMEKLYKGPEDWRRKVDGLFENSLQDFPPALLIGTAPEVLETDGLNPSIQIMRSRQTNDTANAVAASLPITSRGSEHGQCIPPVVATRMVDTLMHLCKNSARFCLDMLVEGLVDKEGAQGPTGFESLLDLLEKPMYSKSSTNLEQLLSLLELIVTPLSNLPKHGDDSVEISQRDMDAAASQGKEWVDVPRVVISQQRLQLLCAILRIDTCKDASFAKVNTIARRLCRVDANRGYVLAELASVSRALGADAIRDLKALNIRMSAAVSQNAGNGSTGDSSDGTRKPANASTSVAVSSSTAELKLLRVLQTLQSLCTDEHATNRNGGPVVVNDEMVQLLSAMSLNSLWSELSACLKVVQVLEGVNIEEDADKKAGENNDGDVDDQNENGEGKKLQNSVAGLLTRFLPSIEAFFVANASATSRKEDVDQDDNPDEDPGLANLVGGESLIEFVSANSVLLNALVRNNSSLLDKGLRSLIQVHRCRVLLDFDVKRHWFKLQVRRLRQQASRRHGSLRLHLRRQFVFEDTYHQLRLRNSEEMRGRLHITFRNEQGVDAGGLSREFFGILAKEIFNPNYALFTSTEDGSTFQPNPNSSINPDHLSYFRFVGRIVGKAVVDGYLLDAHFTRSLYKHMLGIKPTHHDMEAIDPDYYKNLKTILEYDLGDLGLDLTFSIEDNSFGRNQTLDLIENGRKVPVTEENKAKYVSLVCQHRMTTAISSQIKAYLDGFYELVSKDLIQIFTPRELELLISGLPDIDIFDLKKNTDYVGWKSTDRQIEWFWNTLFSLSRKQKASFLQFVTGSSKVPLAGFGELPGMRGVQKFSIHKTGGSSGALMSAHTCFNSLDLPTYSSEEELREKLLYAINEGGGAFLLV